MFHLPWSVFGGLLGELIANCEDGGEVLKVVTCLRVIQVDTQPFAQGRERRELLLSGVNDLLLGRRHIDHPDQCQDFDHDGSDLRGVERFEAVLQVLGLEAFLLGLLFEDEPDDVWKALLGHESLRYEGRDSYTVHAATRTGDERRALYPIPLKAVGCKQAGNGPTRSLCSMDPISVPLVVERCEVPFPLNLVDCELDGPWTLGKVLSRANRLVPADAVDLILPVDEDEEVRVEQPCHHLELGDPRRSSAIQSRECLGGIVGLEGVLGGVKLER